MDWSIFWAAAGVVVAIIIPVALWLADRRKKIGGSEFAVEDADWVTERCMTYEEFVGRLLGLDYSVLTGLTDETAGCAKVKAAVFEKSSDTWALVVFRGSLIVGYWSCFSLSNRLTALVEKGALFDSQIVEAEVKHLSDPGPHDLYFEMFGVHPDFKGQERTIFRLLIQSLADFAQRLQRDGVVVRCVYANGYSQFGASLCRKFGLVPIVGSVQGGDIYRTVDVASSIERLRRLARDRTKSVRPKSARYKRPGRTVEEGLLLR